MSDSARYVKLEPREHCLQRPAIYIGSTIAEPCVTWIADGDAQALVKREISYVPALYKIVDEVIVNSVDHATRTASEAAGADLQRVKNIRVDVDAASGEITVFNDGEGIPVVVHDEHGVYIPSMIFGEMMTGTNYDDSEERMIGGQNGLGAKTANIFSRSFAVETLDTGRKLLFKQTWSDNMAAKTRPSVTKCANKRAFTRVTFTPDFARFGVDGFSADMRGLIAKRVLDVCALTPADVAVSFNGRKLEAKTFEKFADLYLGKGAAGRPRAYERINDRWEIIAAVADGGFDHISFVNGIATIRGGKHVDHIAGQLCRKVVDVLQSRGKSMEHLKPAMVKERLMLFIKASVPNPTFDSQSKETLTSPPTKWGCRVEVGDAFVDKLCAPKLGLVDALQEAVQRAGGKALAKSDGKKKSTVRVPKLSDAAAAGTKKAHECSLILTEGDSALALVISGRAVVGTEKLGAFPLKGKLLNTRDVSAKKMAENEELANLKKILGLQSDKVYDDESVKELRYGRIMLLTDADPDGAHIRALVCNWIACNWPSLAKRPGFLCSMLTPVIKATKGSATHAFHCMNDFVAWKERQASLAGYSMKYYKG